MTPRQGQNGSRSSLERHTQTVMVAVVIGLLAWVGKTVSDQTVTLAKLQVSVSNLESNSRDSYSKSDAREMHTRLQAEIDGLSVRMHDLEERRP
ncbi:MAG: hypothetical protein ACTHMK_13755 [Dyella sp.]|uniref:hypothetical protein n=1 Tax=Dyella sp. TaxID=1869338 RepID=UPI003F7EC32A